MHTKAQTVFLTGGTGLIGRRLVRRLLAEGRTCTVLSRQTLPADFFGPDSCRTIVGDPAVPGPWLEAASDADAVVNLAGEPITARRWSAAFLQRIRDSRVKATSTIALALAANPRRTDGTPKVFVSASGVGCYGADTGEELLSEDRPFATDPMAEVCREWEAATAPAVSAGVCVKISRTGIVLDPDGGALPKLVRPFKLFAGGRIGSGRQYMSWIHRDDMTELLRFALDTPQLSGPFNAVAPNPVTNSEFCRTLGRVLRRPNWLPVPRFALRILLGKVVQVVAGGQRATPALATAAGFAFRYPELEAALRELLGKPDAAKFRQTA